MNDLLKHIPMKEDDGTPRRVRTPLPETAWRKMNEGVPDDGLLAWINDKDQAIEELKAEVKELFEIKAAVAEFDPIIEGNSASHDYCWFCDGDDQYKKKGDVAHQTDCLWLRCGGKTDG